MARQVYGDYGVGGFWNGTAASLVMVVNPTLQYALYEWLTAARARLRWGGTRRFWWARVCEGSSLAQSLLC